MGAQYFLLPWNYHTRACCELIPLDRQTGNTLVLAKRV